MSMKQKPQSTFNLQVIKKNMTHPCNLQFDWAVVSFFLQSFDFVCFYSSFASAIFSPLAAMGKSDFYLFISSELKTK